MRNASWRRAEAERSTNRFVGPIAERLRLEAIEYGVMTVLVVGALVLAVVVVGLAIAGRFDLLLAIV